jgi:hypothetical protein
MSDEPTVRCLLCGYEGSGHDCTTSECRDATLQRIAKLEEEIRLVRGAMASQDGREREAGAQCGGRVRDVGLRVAGAAAEQIVLLRKRCEQQGRQLTAAMLTETAISQLVGKALGYPWYKDDQKNFPGATEADGVCIGEHVAETIVREMVVVVGKLQKIIADRADYGPAVHHLPPWMKRTEGPSHEPC